MSIADQLSRVEEEISRACERAGRVRGEVLLVAVSKTKPVSMIAEAIAAGQADFGENKVQELIAKQPEFAGQARFHLIGHLQKNKIRKVLPHCEVVHTLDSTDLALRLDRIAGELGLRARALLQVNISEDDAKYGLAPEEAESVLTSVAPLEQLEVEGLMTIPRFDPDPEATRSAFRALRELRDGLKERTGLALPQLSMGMSHDFSVAIEEGATIVRVGSAIFGERG